MERLIRLVPLFLLFSSLAACSPWKEVSVDDPQLEGLQWSSEKEASGSTPDQLDLDIRATVRNPNSSSFKVVSSDLTFYLNDKAVGNAELQENVMVPGNSSEEHRFDVKAELKDVASGGLKALGSVIGGNTPELRIEGSIKGRAWGIFTKRFDVEESRQINISDLLGQRSGFRSSMTR